MSALSTLLEVVYLLANCFFLYEFASFVWLAYTESDPGVGDIIGLAFFFAFPWALISIVVTPLLIWKNLKHILNRTVGLEIPVPSTAFIVIRLLVYIPTLCVSLFLLNMFARAF